jgi:hypothetical protein
MLDEPGEGVAGDRLADSIPAIWEGSLAGMNFGFGWGVLWRYTPAVLTFVGHGGADFLVDCFFSPKVGAAVGPPRPTTVVPGKARVARSRRVEVATAGWNSGFLLPMPSIHALSRRGCPGDGRPAITRVGR